MSEQQTSLRVLRGVEKAHKRRGPAGLIAYALYVARHGKDTAEVVQALERAAERAVVKAFAAGVEVALRAGQQSGNQAE